MDWASGKGTDPSVLSNNEKIISYNGFFSLANASIQGEAKAVLHLQNDLASHPVPSEEFS